MTTAPAIAASRAYPNDAADASPERPIRVLFVNDHLGYDDGVVHGVTRYFLNVIPRFDPRVVHAQACFLRGPHPAAQQLREGGIELSFLARRKLDPRALGDLVSLVRRRRIDILHLAGLKSMLLGRVAACRAGCRAVIHVHDTQPLGPALGFLQRRLVRWTDAAVGVSDAVTSLVTGQFGIHRRIALTLHNGVPTDEFASPPLDARQAVRREFRIESDAPVVGMLGRLSSEKQPMLLISALPRLLSAHPRAILLVVGGGSLRAACEDLTVRLGVASSVRFAGQRTDIPRMLAAMDLVAIPSEREGFPFVAVEACAAGKPVVGFRIGGLMEIVRDGETGLLAAPQDVAGFMTAIVKVIQDPVLATRLGEQGKRRASAYGIDRHVRRLEALYCQILASKSRQMCDTASG
jgi:glycosyltransferase involved in cell wall biosynthesis